MLQAFWILCDLYIKISFDESLPELYGNLHDLSNQMFYQSPMLQAFLILCDLYIKIQRFHLMNLCLSFMEIFKICQIKCFINPQCYRRSWSCVKYRGTFYQPPLLQVFVVLCRKYIGTCFKSIYKIELAWHRVDSSKRRNDVENLTLLSKVRSKILHY